MPPIITANSIILTHLDWVTLLWWKDTRKLINETFFEIYDPYSYGERYADGSLKGKDRYYKAADLDLATNNWWDYAIVVSKNTSGGRMSAELDAVDLSTIIHKSGRWLLLKLDINA